MRGVFAPDVSLAGAVLCKWGGSCRANLRRTSSWEDSGVTHAPPIPERILAYCCVYKASDFAARGPRVNNEGVLQ